MRYQFTGVERDHSQRLCASEKRQIFVEQAGRCYYCNRECVPTDSRKMTNEEQSDDLFTIDHIEPRSKGGRTDRGNSIGVCRKCNTEKGDDTVAQWKERIYEEKLLAQDFETVYDPFGILVSERKKAKRRNDDEEQAIKLLIERGRLKYGKVVV